VLLCLHWMTLIRFIFISIRILHSVIYKYESCKPLGSWIYDLKLRVDFFALWADMIINNVEKLIKRTLTTHSATTPESMTPVVYKIHMPHSVK
jgi:hypothetical protein